MAVAEKNQYQTPHTLRCKVGVPDGLDESAHHMYSKNVGRSPVTGMKFKASPKRFAGFIGLSQVETATTVSDSPRTWKKCGGTGSPQHRRRSK